MLSWFSEGQFPFCLAPMAGVTDIHFRQICKEMGADVMVTEFVSAEGILLADHRTRKYTEFTEEQRPIGIQLFGSDGVHMGEAAKKIIDWQRPDFIDINFGCPVNKVISKNGGSSLLRDSQLLASVAENVVKAVGHLVPVTAKMRIGWDQEHINALEIAHILQDSGIRALAVHGRTRSQGYGGTADWGIIHAVAESLSIPVIGNGDIHSPADILEKKQQTAVAGIMIGRAAMANPWIFSDAKHLLKMDLPAPERNSSERWALILRHCRMVIESKRHGDEAQIITGMRSRIMAYCKGFPGAKELRQKLCHISSLAAIEDLAAQWIGSIDPVDF